MDCNMSKTQPEAWLVEEVGGEVGCGRFERFGWESVWWGDLGKGGCGLVWLEWKRRLESY